MYVVVAPLWRTGLEDCLEGGRAESEFKFEISLRSCVCVCVCVFEVIGRAEFELKFEISLRPLHRFVGQGARTPVRTPRI